MIQLSAFLTPLSKSYTKSLSTIVCFHKTLYIENIDVNATMQHEKDITTEF